MNDNAILVLTRNGLGEKIVIVCDFPPRSCLISWDYWR